jgi:flagellar biosynthesis/type III secretory pathway chaperone
MDFNLQCTQFTPEQLAETKQKMVDKLIYWASDRWRNIRLETVEKNLAVLTEIKRYDDQCAKGCMSVQQCPTGDGNRMNGRLMADGVVSIWYEPCPQGYRIPQQTTTEYKPKRQWEG